MSDEEHKELLLGPDTSDLGVSRVSAMTQAVRRYLVVQPKPDALATAKASLLPLLLSVGHDIWHPQVLQLENPPTSSHVRYSLTFASSRVRLDVWAVGESLERAPARDTLPESPYWGLRTNGSHWQIINFTEHRGGSVPIAFNLFDETFPEVFNRLFSTQSRKSLERRYALAHRLLVKNILMGKLEGLVGRLGVDTVRAQGSTPEAMLNLLSEHRLLESNEDLPLSERDISDALEHQLKMTQMGFVRQAAPFANVMLDDVERHCQAVKGFKGQLEATFDDVSIEIRSRSAFYYVLAATALQYGRQDVIPAEDLIRPPDEAPTDGRYRSLGKPGWYLSLGDSSHIETAVATLLDALNLRHRFKATQRGVPFPAESEENSTF